MPLSICPQNLIEISASLGRDRLLVQGAGGNTSLKIGRIMWVKASGKWLLKASQEQIFVPIDLERMRDALSAGKEPIADRLVVGNFDLKPSIETALHAALPYKYVFHLHPVSILSHAVLLDGEQSIATRFVNLPWVWLPYVKPGWELALKVNEIIKSNSGPQIIVLANHGLVVAGDDLCETTDLMRQAVSLSDNAPRTFPEANVDELRKWMEQAKVGRVDVRPAHHSCIHSLALDPVSYLHCRQGVLYPDQAVFLGSEINCSKVIINKPEFQYYVVENIGVFVKASVSAAAEEMLQCHAQLLSRIPAGKMLSTLSIAEVGELSDWDAEKYRQKVK